MISNEPGWQRLSLVLASSTLGLDGGKPGECALQESRGPDELVVPLCDMLAEERYTPFTDEDGKPVVGRIEGLAVAFYKPLGN